MNLLPPGDRATNLAARLARTPARKPTWFATAPDTLFADASLEQLYALEWSFARARDAAALDLINAERGVLVNVPLTDRLDGASRDALEAYAVAAETLDYAKRQCAALCARRQGLWAADRRAA